MIGASEAQCARLEICVSAESNAGIVGLRTKPLRSKDRVWLQFIPAHAQPQLQRRSLLLSRVEFPASSGPNVQHAVNVQHVSVTCVNGIVCGRISCVMS